MTSKPEFFDSLDIATDFSQTKAQKFLHFNLSQELAALVKVEDIAEVLHLPQNAILPIPQMPKGILGIYNWRDEMLWNVSLEQIIGLPLVGTPSFASSMAVIVAQIGSQYLGLVVAQVNDIEWHELDLIQPPTAQLFPAQLLPFMQGYLSDSGAIIIDVQAIAHSPLISNANPNLYLKT
jgi:positive phototaxis protein PixI